MSAGGSEVYYVFILSKQTEGDYINCWMTDGVLPVEETKKSDAGNGNLRAEDRKGPKDGLDSVPIGCGWAVRSLAGQKRGRRDYRIQQIKSWAGRISVVP
jgi:hypothetical protein